jgi:phospholipase/carboxylesterase
MRQRTELIAGLDTTIVESQTTASIVVALLHGYAMEPQDLVPFAHSLRAPATFFFPRGPCVAEPAGRAWWNIDLDRRRAALAAGPRDLADEYPEGRAATRAQLSQFIESIRSQSPGCPIVLAGFSQGGMAICDLLTHACIAVDGLALLSTSRLAFEEWRSGADHLNRMPILISHGTIDDDLSFAAGEKLRDWLCEAGAEVSWVPFEGGHQIPLMVWRRLRQFLAELAAARS